MTLPAYAGDIYLLNGELISLGGETVHCNESIPQSVPRRLVKSYCHCGKVNPDPLDRRGYYYDRVWIKSIYSDGSEDWSMLQGFAGNSYDCYDKMKREPLCQK